MKKGEGKIFVSEGKTGGGTKKQGFRGNEKFSNFRRGGRGRFGVRGRGGGRGHGRGRPWYHPIRPEDAKFVNKFLTGCGAPMGRGHFVYPDTYSESMDEENKHLSIFNQIEKNKRDKKKTPQEILNQNRQLGKLRQVSLKLFNIKKEYGLPNNNHLVALEEYKGWNILDLFRLLSKVKSLPGGNSNWMKRKIDKVWNKREVETPASSAFDELLKHLKPPVLKESLDYAKLFLAKKCSKEIIEIVEEKPERFPGIFLTEIQVLREEASRLLGEKVKLTYEEFFSAVSPVVRNILLKISSEKVKRSWLSIADSFKEYPDLYPMKEKFIHAPLEKKKIHNGTSEKRRFKHP